jgi:hypothetical protein
MERVVREEYFPYERAGEEGIKSLELIEDKICTGGFSAGRIILANSDDRFDLRIELNAWNDFDGLAFSIAYASFDIALVRLEPDVL